MDSLFHRSLSAPVNFPPPAYILSLADSDECLLTNSKLQTFLLSFLSILTLPFLHAHGWFWGCHMIRPQETFGSHMKKWKVWQPRPPRLVCAHWLVAGSFLVLWRAAGLAPGALLDCQSFPAWNNQHVCFVTVLLLKAAWNNSLFWFCWCCFYVFT